MTTAKPAKEHFGRIFHTEFISGDSAGTAEFFAKTFGWKIQDTPHPAYKLFDTPGDFEGHIGPVTNGDSVSSATNYILVECIETAEQSILANGGKLLTPRSEAPGQGFYTGFEAPGGIRMVVWQHTAAQSAD